MVIYAVAGRLLRNVEGGRFDMKVTKTAEQAIVLENQRKAANRGCNVCPCCHETMSSSEAILAGHGVSRGISSITSYRKSDRGLFSSEYKSIDLYRCRRCGAEWESDLY